MAQNPKANITTVRIRIDGELPHLNDYIKAERGNRFAAAKLKQEATQSVQLQSLKYRGTVTAFPADIIFEWHNKPNRGKMLDHDNRCFAKKFVLDGLVKAGVLPNDTPEYVGDFNDIFIDKESENYVIVEIV